MKQNIYTLLNIDVFSATPKYLQLANSVLSALKDGTIEKDDTLPSLNELSYELDVSRDTVEKAYKYLKQAGVLGSVPGKGYYILNTDVGQKYKILLMFNKLSAHKKILFDSFFEALKDSAAIDLYVYNNDYNLFKKLLKEKIDNYTNYVIIPHFNEGGENINEIIDLVPREKILLLDKSLPSIRGEYAAVYENFKQDIFIALEKAETRLKKYQTMKLIFPSNSYYPEEIKAGFNEFCEQYGYKHEIIDSIQDKEITAGEVYINVMEDDLVGLIEKTITLNLTVGKDIGIISYNETPLKKVILNGITTISTDFRKMGEMAAQLILENSKNKYEVPFNIFLRPSL